MKPDWKDAPEWAQWLAMDSDGEWYWYEHAPKFKVRRGRWIVVRGNAQLAVLADCENTCEARPT